MNKQYAIYAYSITSNNSPRYFATLRELNTFSNSSAEILGIVPIANVTYLNPKFIGFTKEVNSLKTLSTIDSLAALVDGI